MKLLDGVRQLPKIFEWLSYFMNKLLAAICRIRATHYFLTPNGTRYRIASENIILPAGTTEFWVDGRFWLRPLTGTFVVFARQENRHWPQHGPYFLEAKKWNSRITIGVGRWSVILAEVNAEIEVAIKHYWKVGKETGQWISLDLDRPWLPGIRKLQEIEVIVPTS